MLTGQGHYTDDWNLPGQLYAAFLRADRAHAEIVAIDSSAAAAAPGVHVILTGADSFAAGFHRTQTLLPFKGRGGEALCVPPRPILAHDRVRYVGEPVAIVVADTRSQAMDAAELIVVEYRALDALADPAAALAPGAVQIHAAVPGNLCFDFDYGDEAATQAAFDAAAHIVRLDLTSGRVVGNSMEPKAALAAWDGDAVDVWAGTQGMTAIHSLAGLTGLPADKIRMRAQDVGGGFGIRGPAYTEYAALVLASQCTGQPVKWLATRTKTFLSDYHGRGVQMTGELALDAAGRFLALRHGWVCDLGAYPVATGPLISTLNPAMMCTGCYAIPVVYGRHRLALTNTIPITAYRGAGRPDMAYVVERLVDQAARQTGIDRLDLRRRNLIRHEDFPYRLPTGAMAAEYDSGNYPALLEAAVRYADWAGFEPRRAEAKQRGKLRGIGCAVFVEPAGGVAPKDEIAITFGPGGITLHTVVASSGQGHETVFPEIVARILQIEPEQITLSAGDPDGPPLAGGGAFASRSMMSHGGASVLAARAVLQKGLELAFDRLEASPVDIAYADGAFRIVGTDRLVTLLDLARAGDGGASALDTTASQPAGRAYPSGAHVVEVEIDPDTGMVELQNYVAVDDCGVVLNPTLLEGQILGGMMQGLGQVLGETCIYDQDGQIQTASFMDYAMPHADLLHRFSLHDLPVPSPNNPLGVKGAGEAGTTGSLPSTMNAILDALRPAGVTHLDMPASAQRVWEVLQGLPAAGSA